MRETCPKSEYLSISEEIYSLAKQVLNGEEIKEAEDLSILLAGSKSKRREAIETLRRMLGVKPKRPLYYCHFHLKYLPRWTRDSVKYMGDYIDQLVKYLAVEKLNNEKCKKLSLGPNLEKLKNKISKELYSNLKKYNEIIYVPAKHKFSIKCKKHLFTSKEVVFICFITAKLRDEIIKISKLAKKYSKDEIEEFE